MRFMNHERRQYLVDEVTRAATYDFVYDLATYVCAAVAWLYFDPIVTPIAVCAAFLYGARASGRGLTWVLPALLLGEPRLAVRCVRNALYFIAFGIVTGTLVAVFAKPDLAANGAIRAFSEANNGVFLLALVAGLAETYAHVRRIKHTATASELASALATVTPLAASVMGGMVGGGNVAGTLNAATVLIVKLVGIIMGSAAWMIWMRLRWYL